MLAGCRWEIQKEVLVNSLEGGGAEKKSVEETKQGGKAVNKRSLGRCRENKIYSFEKDSLFYFLK